MIWWLIEPWPPTQEPACNRHPGYLERIAALADSPLTVVLDVDGTLVDTNYQHAIAWHRAFREHDHAVQLWQIHRHIGMGGDQLVEALIGTDGEEADGEAIREAQGDAYTEMIDEVEAMEGATELLRELRDDGATVVLASSAKEDEVERYLHLLDAGEIVAAWTSGDDVEETKPEPDLVGVALEKAGVDGPAIMIGDSTWDIKAAKAAGVPTLAVLTGGFSAEELTEAGAARVVESIGELRKCREILAELARGPS